VSTAEEHLISLLADQGVSGEAARLALEALPDDEPRKPPRPALGRPGAPLRRREKMFGVGRPRALDRNAKTRIMHLARCLSRRTEKGRAYGRLTAKFVEVLRALLWGFHNAKSGLCFPSYERIAEAAGCARSTVAEALKALEDAQVLSWVHRIKRVREQCSDLLGADGWRWRVLKTSNAYDFRDPGSPDSSKSEKPPKTQKSGQSPGQGAKRLKKRGARWGIVGNEDADQRSV
jgi:hypothetical protein